VIDLALEVLAVITLILTSLLLIQISISMAKFGVFITLKKIKEFTNDPH